ncbi:MAG TPA: hypothetical protein VLH15_03500 [Dehalococcoidales bacterium]|nr:hypothetical protein [Dehalococcoidales bacterium]
MTSEFAAPPPDPSASPFEASRMTDEKGAPGMTTERGNASRNKTYDDLNPVFTISKKYTKYWLAIYPIRGKKPVTEAAMFITKPGFTSIPA